MVLDCQDKFHHPYQIITLGDSNGAGKAGWVHQLKKIMPVDSIHNMSISGNTIGFDNLENPNLNNLDVYLGKGSKNNGYLVFAIILLGTNDSKVIFKDREKEVLRNMELLIDQIRNFDY